MNINVDDSDLHKILDVLRDNELFHKHRDIMNGQIHLAKETRYSPITSETMSAKERLELILSKQK